MTKLPEAIPLSVQTSFFDSFRRGRMNAFEQGIEFPDFEDDTIMHNRSYNEIQQIIAAAFQRDLLTLNSDIGLKQISEIIKKGKSPENYHTFAQFVFINYLYNKDARIDFQITNKELLESINRHDYKQTQVSISRIHELNSDKCIVSLSELFDEIKREINVKNKKSLINTPVKRNNSSNSN